VQQVIIHLDHLSPYLSLENAHFYPKSPSNHHSNQQSAQRQHSANENHYYGEWGTSPNRKGQQGDEREEEESGIENDLRAFCRQLPLAPMSTQVHGVIPRNIPSINKAREKWSHISFGYEKSENLDRAKAAEVIVQQQPKVYANMMRTLLGGATSIPFPDHVTEEAKSYVPPRLGIEWEAFDSVREIEEQKGVKYLVSYKGMAGYRKADKRQKNPLRDSSSMDASRRLTTSQTHGPSIEARPETEGQRPLGKTSAAAALLQQSLAKHKLEPHLAPLVPYYSDVVPEEDVMYAIL